MEVELCTPSRIPVKGNSKFSNCRSCGRENSERILSAEKGLDWVFLKEIQKSSVSTQDG